MSSQHFWVIRVPKGEEYIAAVEMKGLVAVGYSISQSVADVTDREAMKKLYRDEVPNAPNMKVAMAVGQLYRVAHVIQPGDWILSPDRDTRTLLYGQVEGEYIFQKDVLGPGYSHARKVKWQGRFRRDDMSSSLRNTMGSLMTVLNMDGHRDELLRLVKGEISPGGEKGDDESVIPFDKEMKAKADELIGDLISRIDPYDFQELVAGLLQAMGYRTRVSPPGPDQGVDVIAHPDAFGFEAPRIKVQVKHRQSAATGPEIRSLVGSLGQDEKGLFVSTGGFTKDARVEARRTTRLTLLDADNFVSLLAEYYEKLDADYKALVPLRKVWVPAS